MKLKKLLKIVVLSLFLQLHVVYSQSVTYEAELMTKSGPYAGTITSPFNGLALYANGDAGSTTAVLPIAPGQYTVTVIGASNNSTSASASLEVDGLDVGSFSFAGTTATSASKTISFTGNASKLIKLIMKTDTGVNDVYIDKITFTYIGEVPAPRSAPVIPAVGAVASGVYRNMFVEAGYNSADVTLKINNTFQQLFYGNNQTERVYYPVGTDEAYILDTGNGDVRTEGMSYGMMICVQLDKKAEFNKIWKWAYTYMRHSTGARKGYFAWQCSTAGAKMDANTASDGEEYFATALLFASKRCGNGTGIFNYRAEANSLLEIMQNKENPVVESITNLFNVTEKQVVFVPYASAALFTDPSYHVPAFYEVWATSADTNNAFWSEVATTSRVFFPKTANATTGLMPDYAKFDGTSQNQGGHGDFRFDAWRCIMNMAVDYTWYKKSTTEKVIAQKIQTFFKSKGMNSYGNQYAIDGTVLSTGRSPGLIACNAVGSLASDSVLAWEFIDELYATGIPSGQYRYYDGLLYFISLLHVAGEFKAYIPEAGAVTPPTNAILSTNTPPTAVRGATITASFNYTAAAAGTCQIQLFKTDASGNIDYSAGTALYFTGPVPAAATSTLKSQTFTVPTDLPLSNTLPAGVVYKWFFKLTVPTGVGTTTDYYPTSYPIMEVVASTLSTKSFNVNGVKVIYNAKTKNLVFYDVENSEMAIYDVKGSRVMGLNTVIQNSSFDLSSLSNGLYFLKSNNGSVYKFVVQ